MARGEPIYPIPRCMRTGHYELIFYRDGSESTLDELKNACEGPTEIDTALNKASARAFLGRMQYGLLAYDADPVELQEVASQTGILELYPLTTSHLARGYSADPEQPEAIVICLLHLKDVSGTAKEIRDRHNLKMQEAKDRFEDGESFRWSAV